MAFVFSVNVVMKGSHGYISITEWPLMIVSRCCKKSLKYFKGFFFFYCLGFVHVINDLVIDSIIQSRNTIIPEVSIAVKLTQKLN